MMNEENTDMIRETLVEKFPDLEAVYLFGSVSKGTERIASDVDIALLLRPEFAFSQPVLAMSPTRAELKQQL